MACFNKIQLIMFVLSITLATLSRHAISTILSSNSTILNNSSPLANDGHAPAKRHVYNQTLDHWNLGYLHRVSFNQSYYIDSSYWVGAQANGPILVFFGGEGPISDFVNRIGIINLSAPKLGALIVYIEHRFYGESVPMGSIDEAINDPDTRNCLNVEQALTDFADIIQHIKKNLSAPNSPVIVIGGSYAGMLAVWYRLRYPLLSIGALASSAPLLNFGVIAPQHQNCWIVSQDFKEKSEKCYNIIRQSWTIIDTVASQPNGLTSLSHQFRTCKPLSSAWDLKSYLSDLYSDYAQYDTPKKNLVSGFCKIIVNPSNGDIIQGIASAVNKMFDTCNDLNEPSPSGSTQFVLDYASRAPWNWQLCTEIVITSEEYCGDDTLLLPNTRNSSVLSEFCSEAFGVRPDPLWMSSHFYFGDDVLIALNKYSSNIIFSNGLRDPFSGTGILEDISKTIIALKTNEGTHCLDLNDIRKDDPKWLKKQRKKELHIFKKWIHQHSGAFTNKHTFFTSILNLFVVNYFYYLLW
ncbi:unnamed protein product [Amaranthus hypochondriacus]